MKEESVAGGKAPQQARGIPLARKHARARTHTLTHTHVYTREGGEGVGGGGGDGRRRPRGKSAPVVCATLLGSNRPRRQ